MKLSAKQKEILSLLVKGKGQFKTPTIPKYVGPSNEHMVRFKWYVLNIDKKKTIKDIRSVIKAGQIA